MSPTRVENDLPGPTLVVTSNRALVGRSGEVLAQHSLDTVLCVCKQGIWSD